MKTRMSWLLGVFTIASLALGMGAARAHDGQSNGVAQSVQGGGWTNPSNNETRYGEVRFGLTALKDEHGEVKGQLNLIISGEVIHADVVCLAVRGNRALVVGITKGGRSGSVEEGSVVFFAVDDNGEGRNEPPDSFSMAIAAPGFDYERICDDIHPELFPLPEIVQGNIQVDDGTR